MKAILFAVAFTACAAEPADDTEDIDPVDEPDGESMPEEPPIENQLRVVMSQQTVVDAIRTVAAQKGITNPILIAGIANAETSLAHCRADYYTQLCKQSAGTPVSPSCGGGSVLVGNADSSCDQGGLGLFQIDYGTQKQTIAHYGASVLSLNGNIGFGIDHILEDVRVCSLTPSFGSDHAVAIQRAKTWLNGVRRGSSDYATFFTCMSRHYNGAGTQAQANYYRNKTEEVFTKYGAPSTGHPGTVNTDGTPLTIRAAASTTSASRGNLADGAQISIRCQKRGQSLTGTYGTSDLWDDIGNGFVADVYVSTGSDGQVAPTCQ
jgi:hypothetical protein